MSDEHPDPLTGVERIGIWPGQSREYRRDDWIIGFKNWRGNGDQLARVRNADRDKAHQYYLSLHDKDYSHSWPYLSLDREYE